VNAPRPVAVGHVFGVDDLVVERQRAEVTRYVEAEGLALAGVLHDHRDRLTTSQVADAARQLGAAVVVLLSWSRLAGASTRLASELERHGIRCVMLGAIPRPTAPAALAVRPRA
jgi:glycine cleavage system regulatory protein